MAVKFANFAKSKIANVGGIAATDTSLTLEAGDGALFPSLSASDHFYIVMVDSSGNREVAKVTARSTDDLTIVRGQDGTTARAFAQGDIVELRLNKGALEDLQDEMVTADETVTLTNKTLTSPTLTSPKINEAVSLAATSTEIDTVSHGSTAKNNHTHSEYTDIPSGEIILFEKDTAVAGYTLQTDFDDGVVYITSGSGAGGEAGGTDKTGGTWTQPVHSHTVADHDHDAPVGIDTGMITWNTTPPFGTGGSFSYNKRQDYSATGTSSYMKTSTNGPGSTGDNATANTWRPSGRNFTRQQRN